MPLNAREHSKFKHSCKAIGNHGFMKEDELQTALAAYLDSLCKYEYKGRLGWFHTPNETMINNAKIGFLAKRKRLGVKSGVPDILLLFEGGRCAFVELKVDRHKVIRADPHKLLSDNQKAFFDMLKCLGHNRYVLACKTISEGIEGISRIVKRYLW